MMKVAIVGLGLMGGSLGLCLKENKFISCVLGYDIDKENANLALKLGLIHELMSEFNPQELANCDIIVLATPVDAIVSLVKELENLPQSTTLIELGSTKTKIVKATPKALKPHIIYAHPMCGTENSGASAAFKELYSGAVCVLCDSETADDTHQKRAVEIFSHLGMKIVFMDSTSHDHHAAIISHLPHAISFALANFVMKEEGQKGHSAFSRRFISRNESYRKVKPSNVGKHFYAKQKQSHFKHRAFSKRARILQANDSKQR